MGVDARVLVVDDSLVVRKLIEMNIRNLGNVEVVDANDGMAGLRCLTEGDFDLALVDINMPVMDGLTLLRLYLLEGAGPKTPIVIVTTEGDSETGAEALRLGASGYITKPINAKVLRKVTTELIEKFQTDKASSGA